MKRIVSLWLNGRRREDAVQDNLLLIDYIRETAALTGTKCGCDGGECGACTVLIDNEPRLSCMTLAANCEGKRIETIEGLARGGELSSLQRSFHEKLGTQCGFCTPGMIMAVEGLLRDVPDPDEAAIRDYLSGNLCRCGTYSAVIDAVKEVIAGQGGAQGQATAR